jgi:hypothetical protein
VVITKSPSTTKPQSPVGPSVDNQQVLLSLAEEYIGAAHGLGFIAATSHNEVDSKRYYKLMATGLGCMEALLKVDIHSITGQQRVLTYFIVVLQITAPPGSNIAPSLC